MSTGEKRIFELTETQTFGNGDYLPLDNISNSETKKIEAKKLGITYTMTDTEDGFSFDGSNGYHYEKVIPKDAQMSYDDYEDLTEAEKMDGSNRFIPDYPEEEKQPEIWTRVGRDPLTTDEKTVSKAINELDSRTKAVNGDAFDDTVTYSKGDYSIYDNKMYVYTSDTPSSGSWDSTKWTQTDIQTEFTQIKSNLTELEEYSETEQVVGKWIDGKTLYRKVYTCPSFSVTSSSTAQTYTVFTFPSNTNIIKYFCVLNHSTSKYMLPYSNGNKTSSCVGIKGTTPYIQIRVTNDGWTGVTVTTEAYYTKNS